MQVRSILGAVVVSAALAACGTSNQGTASVRSSGAATISADGLKAYFADADNDQVVEFDLATEAVTNRITVGRGPERVLGLPNGQIAVSNRFDRSVSFIDPAVSREVSRVTVGTEPVGLALSEDGANLVVSNTTSNTLSVVELASRTVTRTIPVGADPTGIAITGDKAYVTHFRNGTVSVLDLPSGTQRGTVSLALGLDQTFGESRKAGLAAEVVVTPDGQAIVPHTQAKDEPIPTDVGGGSAYVSGVVPVVATAVAQIDVTTDTVVPVATIAGNDKVAPDCFDCGMPGMRGVGGAFVTSFSAPIAGPGAAVVDSRGQWLFIVNEFSNNVVVRNLRDGTTLEPVAVGAGPRGIALSKDGLKAYVYNAIDHSVTILGGSSGGIVAQREVRVGQSNLTPQQELGRRLFFSATDGRMTSANTNPANGIACASCHPSGREDGRTWKFSEGRRNTPTLAGRHLAETAPYHWDGLLEDMHAFKLVVEERMGGSREDGSTGGQALTAGDFNAIMAYLDSQATPDHPARGLTHPSAARGKAIFEGKATCGSCHTGENLTDNKFWDVGTVNGDDRFPKLVNTPSLHNLAVTAPYLHDGSIATLRDRVTKNPGDRHGVTSILSAAEVDDLVAYLGTL